MLTSSPGAAYSRSGCAAYVGRTLPLLLPWFLVACQASSAGPEGATFPTLTPAPLPAARTIGTTEGQGAVPAEPRATATSTLSPTAGQTPTQMAAATPAATRTEETVIRYWTLISQRRYEEAWEILSWSFRSRNFNHEIDRYIEEFASIGEVKVLSAQDVSTDPGSAQVEARLEFVSTAGVAQARLMTFNLIYDQSTETWHIDSAEFNEAR